MAIRTKEHKERYRDMFNWMVQKDVFWIQDLLLVFPDNRNHCVFMRILKDLGAIQCCEKRGSQRQYIVINSVMPVEFL